MEKIDPAGKNYNPDRRPDGFSEKYFGRFKEINRKYAEPQIKMTRMVRFSLIGLRIYLLILIVVLGYKFFTLVRT